MTEIWKSLKGIVEYGDYYEISNFGHVRSLDRVFIGANNRIQNKKGSILKPKKGKNGYLSVNLKLNRKSRMYYVHRLVALAFIVNDKNSPEVNHKDGNKSNNNIDNLEWSTGKENIGHAIETGLIKMKGKDNAKSKLNEEDVLKIRELYKSGEYKYKELGIMFNVSIQNISFIVTNQRWKHI
jgi:hypothetical protein